MLVVWVTLGGAARPQAAIAPKTPATTVKVRRYGDIDTSPRRKSGGSASTPLDQAKSRGSGARTPPMRDFLCALASHGEGGKVQFDRPLGLVGECRNPRTYVLRNAKRARAPSEGLCRTGASAGVPPRRGRRRRSRVVDGSGREPVGIPDGSPGATGVFAVLPFGDGSRRWRFV
jgi:hypothetical protein